MASKKSNCTVAYIKRLYHCDSKNRIFFLCFSIANVSMGYCMELASLIKYKYHLNTFYLKRKNAFSSNVIFLICVNDFKKLFDQSEILTCYLAHQ